MAINPQAVLSTTGSYVAPGKPGLCPRISPTWRRRANRKSRWFSYEIVEVKTTAVALSSSLDLHAISSDTWENGQQTQKENKRPGKIILKRLKRMSGKMFLTSIEGKARATI
ncbi:uncharacterized protein LOC135164502 [Diachasmimorpha longicaudata]|uniref:uncharacterized protein LOC135164502 n=1 Tax=Diachasmimorpha longicaudata TaxID=58733 RepID=UPI0030B8B5E4